jgi:SP family general alpha glucoside:H+ symporter-like MFS transporter
MHRDSAIEKVPTDSNALHPADTVVRNASVAVENFAGLSAEAKNATTKEHSMSFMQAIRLYPKAVGWSMLLSMAIVMEGYDVILLSSSTLFLNSIKNTASLVPMEHTLFLQAGRVR